MAHRVENMSSAEQARTITNWKVVEVSWIHLVAALGVVCLAGVLTPCQAWAEYAWSKTSGRTSGRSRLASSEFAKLEAESRKAKADLKAVAGQIETKKKALDGLLDAIQRGTEPRSVNSRIEKLNRVLRELDAKKASLSSKIRTLDSELASPRFWPVEKRLAALEAAVAGNATGATPVAPSRAASVSSPPTPNGAGEPAGQDAPPDKAKLEAEKREGEVALRDLESEITTRRRAVDALVTALEVGTDPDAVKGRIGELKGELKELEERKAAIEAKISETGAILDSPRFWPVEKRLEAIEKALGIFQKTMANPAAPPRPGGQTALGQVGGGPREAEPPQPAPRPGRRVPPPGARPRAPVREGVEEERARVEDEGIWTLPGAVIRREKDEGGPSELISGDVANQHESVLERDYLFGKLWGARPRLEKHGQAVNLVYTGEGFRNASGGLNTDKAREYRGDVSLTVEVDTAAADWWEGGSFFLHAQQQNGRSITNDYVGDFQVLSNIDADDFAQVSELWYKHSFADDRVWLKLGKQDATADFSAPEYGGEFSNSSPGFAPTIPMVTFPDPDLGVVLGVQPHESFSLNIGVYQGRPDGGRSLAAAFDNLSVPMVMIEPAFHYVIKGNPGHLRVGYWSNGDSFARLDGTGDEDGSHGWYLTWDQQLWEEPGDKEGQGIGLFVQYGWAPGDRSEAEQYMGGGVQWVGPFPSRDDDVLGLGVFTVFFSDDAGFLESRETATEFFYKVQLTKWMSAKLDVQYIANPGGSSNDDALAIGIRLEVSL